MSAVLLLSRILDATDRARCSRFSHDFGCNARPLRRTGHDRRSSFVTVSKLLVIAENDFAAVFAEVSLLIDDPAAEKTFFLH